MEWRSRPVPGALLRRCSTGLIRQAVAIALGCFLAAAGTPLARAEVFRLVSAQVITRTEGPPTLRLAANGPIAFRVLPPEATGDPASPNRVVARLHGVAPGDGVQLAGGAALAPFSLSTRAEGNDTILTVTATAGVRLEIRAAMRSNELDIVARAIGE
jgi:hypothetical protein